jgi:hypothetical protein
VRFFKQYDVGGKIFLIQIFAKNIWIASRDKQKEKVSKIVYKLGKNE